MPGFNGSKACPEHTAFQDYLHCSLQLEELVLIQITPRGGFFHVIHALSVSLAGKHNQPEDCSNGHSLLRIMRVVPETYVAVDSLLLDALSRPRLLHFRLLLLRRVNFPNS